MPLVWLFLPRGSAVCGDHPARRLGASRMSVCIHILWHCTPALWLWQGLIDVRRVAYFLHRIGRSER